MGVLDEQRKLKAAQKAAAAKRWAASPPSEASKGIAMSAANKAALEAAVKSAGRKNGGLAEIPDVRSALSRLGGRSELDEFMQAAERAGWIDLKTANDPKLIPNKDEAIKRTSRDGFGERTNHLYYAVTR